MGSEDQVLNLMRLLDDGIQQAEVIESKLDNYDKILQVWLFFNNRTKQKKGKIKMYENSMNMLMLY